MDGESGVGMELTVNRSTEELSDGISAQALLATLPGVLGNQDGVHTVAALLAPPPWLLTFHRRFAAERRVAAASLSAAEEVSAVTIAAQTSGADVGGRR
ncbi:hypothetical protein GCM10010195_53610 [Kitasatospora griseola]|nr:hypothetical protein GCM10010195_53610 [Kitasatospora griseola]